MSTDTTAPPTVETVLAIPDSLDRAKAIAEVLLPATRAVDKARKDRAAAALVLVENHGWPQVRAYELAGVSRSMFTRMRKRWANTGEPLPKWSKAKAEKAAREATVALEENEPVVETWRELRDETISALWTQHPELSNVEIGALFGLTGQRISIMRGEGR